MAKKKDARLGFFYRPLVKRYLWALLIGSSLLFVALELFVDRHSHFSHHGFTSMDGVFGFYSVLGFLSCLILILLAKLLGLFLKAKVTYYDDVD